MQRWPHRKSPSRSRSSYKTKNGPPPGRRILNEQTTSASASSRIDNGASRGSWYLNKASVNVRRKAPDSPFRRITPVRFLGEKDILETLPRSRRCQRKSSAATAISDESAFHLFNMGIASSRDERIFLLTAVALGLEEAIYQASIYRWKCQRPLRVLRAMMYESGRSYTKRSAARKLPSGSPASLKRRS